MLGTKLCDRCWELEKRITSDPAIARKILAALPENDEGREVTLDRHSEEALDSLEAAFFSGDGFIEEPGIKRARYFLARWERCVAEHVESLKGETHT